MKNSFNKNITWESAGRLYSACFQQASLKNWKNWVTEKIMAKKCFTKAFRIEVKIDIFLFETEVWLVFAANSL